MDIDPSVSVCGTDYTKDSVRILKDYFLGASEVFEFDLLSFDNYTVIADYDVAIMGRISTELDKNQWKRVFGELYNTSKREIVFIPTEVLSVGIAINEIFNHFCHVISGKKDTFCGYMYSQREFEEMFGQWKIKQYFDDEDAMWILKR